LTPLLMLLPTLLLLTVCHYEKTNGRWVFTEFQLID